MDKSQVRGIVEDNIKRMMSALQVQDWSIDVSYGPNDGDFAGATAVVMRRVDYKIATINFDPEQLGSEETVLRALRHELLHLHLGQVDVYREAVGQFLPTAVDVTGVEERIWRYAHEQVVHRLEMMLDHGLKYQPWKSQEIDAVRPA